MPSLVQPTLRCLTQALMSPAANRIVRSLLEEHGWTLEEAGLVETELLRDPSKTYYTSTSTWKFQPPPFVPPDIARLGELEFLRG